jgi:hypothetical protein
MFLPTHVLISRAKATPVQLVAAPGGYHLYTEADWQQGRTPAFELKPKQGIYCQGVQVVGFRLQPIDSQTVIKKAPSPKTSQTT